MIRTAARHATWWRAPLVASSLAVPFLLLEYRWFASEGESGAFSGVLYWSFGLLAFAWLLPHRRALRTPRMLAAGLGLLLSLLPLLWLMIAISVAPSTS
ncbi:hypothetical protein [Streptomyces griseosporeus]|uniref:hypothetical protein n=1 Tax=Streptomyces griseosporeus TaxID=1910 RepID=UPI0036FA30F9